VSIRDRLLEALNDTCWHDLTDAGLVEALIARLQQAEADAVEARSAASKEAHRAHEMQEDLIRQIRELRTNPLAAVSRDFYFDDCKSGVFVVSVHAGRVTLMQRKGRIDYAMQQIDAETYARRVTDQI